MRRGLIIALAAFAVVFAAAFSFGCTWIGDALQNAGKKQDHSSESGLDRSPSPTSFATSAPSGENPVSAVFYNYFRIYDECTGGLIDAVYDSEDPFAAQLIMELMLDEADISSIYATVGMLPQDDDGSAYSGSITGALAGSGRVSGNGDIVYSFDSGNTIIGSVRGGLINCRLTKKAETVSITFSKAANVFTAWTERGGMARVLEVGSSGLRYARFETSLLKNADRTEFPDIESAAMMTYKDGELSVTGEN